MQTTTKMSQPRGPVVIAATLALLLLVFPCSGTQLTGSTPGVVKLAVIAPADSHHEQSLPRVLPAVLMAVKAVSSPRGPLPGWTIKVDHRDSQCSSTYGPLAAFEFYINGTAGCGVYFSLFVRVAWQVVGVAQRMVAKVELKE